MDIRKLDLNLLVVLEAIHAEGSLTRAAPHLNLSPPAVSHALSRPGRIRAFFQQMPAHR